MQNTFKLGDTLDGPDDLEKLPPGARILDFGLYAEKTESGAWRYDHDGQYWEPEAFPMELVSLPEWADRCDPARDYHSTPHRGCILR